MATSPTTLYIQVVRITHVYLGPAADRFINRQIHNHLHKEPEKISPADLEGLIAWIRIAVSLITDNSELVEEYTNQLESLANRAADPKKNKRAL